MKNSLQNLHLLIDVQCLQGEDSERGIPRWTTNFLEALEAAAPGKITALFNESLPFTGALSRLAALTDVRPNQAGVIADLSSELLCYVVMSIYEPVRPLTCLLPTYIPACNVPVVAVIHDLIPHLFPDLYSYSQFDRRLNHARESLFRSADALLCNSSNTSRDVVEGLGASPHRVHVVGTGIDRRFTSATKDHQRLQDLGISGEFVFVVGRADPRKQTGKLIEAFASLPLALRDSLSLVVACRVSEEILEHWHSIGRSFGLGSDKLKIVGLVSDDDLRLLYSTTSLFVEPSIYEGFGLPAAEAAACGAVTITSNVSSLPEVLADPHAVFDPRDTSSLVSLMTKALTDQEFRQQRLASNSDIANRHSWVDVATRSLRVFSSVARQASLLS